MVTSLIVVLLLGTYQIDWGLPFGRHSWAVDGLDPLTVLEILSHSFGRWNSGWFYFKYPLAYPLSLGAAYAPYLTYLLLTHAWVHPTSTYPYGFANPERAMFVMALLGRGLSVLFTLGTIAAAYGIARRLATRRAARFAAFLAATCYPFVYYAHTMNVDASYLFWLLASLYFAVVASQSDEGRPWLFLGMTAALAVSTKEQAFGFLLPLPLLAVASRMRARGTVRALWSRPVGYMVAGAIACAAVANNALFNPLGVAERIAFLLGHPLAPVEAPLKPVSFALFKGWQEWAYLRQLGDGLVSALGLPLAAVAAAGLVTVGRARRTAVWLLSPAIAYYYLSLRGQQLITMRYSLPMVLLSIVLASIFLGEVWSLAGNRNARVAIRVAIVALLGLSLARGAELDLLLRNDARYAAESWIGTHLPPDSRGEIYQKETYLPRFPRQLAVEEIPFDQRTVAGVRRRNPDFIVLSSASWQSIFGRWNPDWHGSKSLLIEMPEAKRMLEALTEGRLGYRRVAVFRQHPRLLRVGITGLCPTITIYRREETRERTSSG